VEAVAIVEVDDAASDASSDFVIEAGPPRLGNKKKGRRSSPPQVEEEEFYEDDDDSDVILEAGPAIDADALARPKVPEGKIIDL